MNNGTILSKVSGDGPGPGPFTPFSNDYSFEFDGTDDYVSIYNGASGSGPIQFTASDDFSISAWIKTSSLSLTNYILSFRGTALIWLNTFASSGNIRARLYLRDNSSNVVTISTFNNSTGWIAADTWTNVIVTRNGTTKELNIYLNGQSAQLTTSDTTTDDFTLYDKISIGNDNYTTGRYWFDGKIDEVSIFNTELSSGNISTIYNNGTPSDLTSLNPVVWYRMGDNAVYKSPQWLLPNNENKDKISNYSMSFDGTNDYVETSNTFSLLDGQTTATFSMWIKPDAIGAYQYLFSVVRSATSTEFQVSCYLDNVGRIRVFGDSTARYVYSNTGVVSAGVWTHLCVTFDLSQPLADRVSIYIDGVDEVAVGFAQMHQTQFATSTSGLAIGRNQNGHLPNFAGLIDDVSVWDSDQSANVSTIYNGGVPSDLSSLNPINYWRMSENATFKDPQWLLPNNENKDKFSNYSMSFDGTDDYISLNSLNSTLQPLSVGTISMWWKPTNSTPSPGECLFSVASTTVTNDYFAMYNTSSGKFYAQLKDNNTNYWVLETDTAVFLNDAWAHVVIRHNGTEPELYVNGSKPSQTFTISINKTKWWDDITIELINIGSLIWSGGHSGKATGNIDEVSVFDSALSSGDISAIYNNGTPTDLTSLNPIAYYKMGDDATFSTNWTIPDQTGSNDGTSANMDINDRAGDAPSSSGNTVSYNMDINDRVGEAPGSENNALSYNMVLSGRTIDVPKEPFSKNSMSFDGTDDYIDLSQQNLGTTNTISLWLKNPSVKGVVQETLLGNPLNTFNQFLNVDWNTGKMFYKDNSNNRVEWNTLSNINNTNWNNIIITRVGATVTLYFNGVSQGTGTSFGTLGDSEFRYLGINFNSNTQAFEGNIDEMAVWDTDQTSNISTIYNNGEPTDLTSLSPHLWFRLGENATFKDPQWLIPNNENKDKFSNYSMSFDGTNDYIDCGDSNDFSFGNGTTDSPFSVSFWLNASTFATNLGIISKDYDGSNREWTIGQFSSSNKIRFLLKNNGGGNQQSIDSTNTLSTGQWYHIVCTYDGSGGNNAADGLTIYIDGTAETPTNITKQTYTAMANTIAPLTFGAYQTGASQLGISGKIDDVSIFSVELSSSEVSTIWNNGIPKDESGTPNLVGYWRMGEESIVGYIGGVPAYWTIPDQVGGNDGISTNMTIDDRVGDAPDSSGNTVSFNMDINDKTTDVP